MTQNYDHKTKAWVPGRRMSAAAARGEVQRMHNENVSQRERILDLERDLTAVTRAFEAHRKSALDAGLSFATQAESAKATLRRVSNLLEIAQHLATGTLKAGGS